MRTLWSIFALIVIAAAPALAQDPVTVDPDHYKVVFENEQVRVLRITYAPQEESVMHAHPAGVAVFLDDFHGQFTMPDGQTVEMEGKEGDAIWAEGGTHQPKNIGDDDFELILVELKSPGHESHE